MNSIFKSSASKYLRNIFETRDRIEKVKSEYSQLLSRLFFAPFLYFIQIFGFGRNVFIALHSVWFPKLFAIGIKKFPLAPLFFLLNKLNIINSKLQKHTYSEISTLLLQKGFSLGDIYVISWEWFASTELHLNNSYTFLHIYVFFSNNSNNNIRNK